MKKYFNTTVRDIAINSYNCHHGLVYTSGLDGIKTKYNAIKHITCKKNKQDVVKGLETLN